MSNELLWILFLLLDLSFTVVVFKVFGKGGLLALIAADIILCNIQVTKIVQLFGLSMTLGNILYGSIFLATDILSELYGPKEARKGVLVGFFFLFFMTGVMQVALLFKPDPSDFINEHLKAIFGLMPRIALASVVAYLISQYHDVWAFQFWKKLTQGKFLWLRNNLSTMVSQAIDTLVFCGIAFFGLFPAKVFLEIVITTYIMKWIVAAVDTPFLYLVKKLAQGREEIAEA